MGMYYKVKKRDDAQKSKMLQKFSMFWNLKTNFPFRNIIEAK